MLFMNESEIEAKRDRLVRHPTLGPATDFLYEFMREVNEHSDGWPYWKAPVHAAAKLMALIYEGEATEAQVKAALTPIKTFMTKRGTAAGMKMTATGLASKAPKMERPTSTRIINITVETAGRAAHAIAHLMSGSEWNADTLDSIAKILIEAGFTIEEPK